jgi:predicted ATPase/DNA-binding SARP family transcriptional activator
LHDLVQVRVLGPVRVGDRIETATAPRGERPRDVLAVLVARRGRPVPAEVVLDLVWGDAATALTTAAVHTVVARLRRQFGEGLVRTTDAGYVVPVDVGLDAERFTALAADAAEEGDEIGRCREALALWSGGTAYAGVRDDLVMTERVRLEELLRRVRGDLAAALLAPAAPQDDVAEAMGIAAGLVTEHPLDEGAAVLAMRAADRLQRQGEALEVFARLRDRLREELGVDPGAVAAAVHARILARDAETATQPAGRRVHPGLRLPVPASPTIGRRTELASVLGALSDGRRLVTVTGPGGVGKSRLLADVGAALATDHDVVHVALSGHQAGDAQDLAAALAVTTGVPLAADDSVASLVRALQTSDVVVLVDEAEWALGPAAELARAILAGCPGVRLVVTSRVPLTVVGERVLPLGPLPEPDAVRLLIERLADRGVPTSDAADRGVLAEVVRRVDGLPLALELVAGRARAVSVRDLLDVVERPLDLESDEVGRDARQQSLRRTISWSVDRLEPAGRDALLRLAVFAGAFHLPAARALSGSSAAEAERVVADLATYHLVAVERTDAGVAFRMLRTVRDLALEELAAAGRLDGTRARHAEWFAGLWRDAPLSDELVEHVGRTYDDHLEALGFLLETGQIDSAVDVALALTRRWLFVESVGPGLTWTGRLLARGGMTERQRARLQVARAAFRHSIDWTPDEHRRIAAALVDDPDWACQLGLVEAITAYALGDVDRAMNRLGHCLALAGERARHHLPEIVATRAVLEAADGRHDLAVVTAHEAEARVGASVTAVELVTVLPKVGLALLDAGEPREALDLLTRSAEQAADRFGIRPTGTIAVNAGWAALALGEPEEALAWFARSLHGPQAFVTPGATGESAVGAAAAMTALGRPGAAELRGQGEWLLAADGNVLPPSLAAHAQAAADEGGVRAVPDGWTAELAGARVAQLLRAALA